MAALISQQVSFNMPVVEHKQFLHAKYLFVSGPLALLLLHADDRIYMDVTDNAIQFMTDPGSFPGGK